MDNTTPWPEHLLGPSRVQLRATRAIAQSPWDPREFYLGGFDAHGGPHTDTAWIFKGVVPGPILWPPV